ncbi:MAG: Uncharacterized protein Athens101410_682 [Parcubacteria group bacterium Athens1014_10]|nr:MAG: Uncharacterized protein Athens101410_682 [Parcubacteria group bacterium Athens1014_10]TSD04595.1 MAG: Uncharacterized protein Athens071412_732 [Parcubacteria group bacterium Athens0714_12]
MNENIIRLNPSQAAQLFGVNERTIRRALKQQKLRYIVVRGRYKINFESLVEWSQKNISRKGKLNQEGIGQYVERWKIKNKLFSPSPEAVKSDTNDTNEHTNNRELQNT